MSRSRRTFLGAIFGTFIGLSTGCVSSGENAPGSGNDGGVGSSGGISASSGTAEGIETTSIVVAKSGDEVAMTANVPAKWQRQAEKADHVEKLVERKYSDLPGYRDAYIVNAEESIGDHHYSAVEVAGTKNHIDSLRDAIPNRIRGVKVKIAVYDGAVAT